MKEGRKMFEMIIILGIIAIAEEVVILFLAAYLKKQLENTMKEQ